MIPYGRQEITQEDEVAVLKALRSPFLTQGPEVPRFEAAVCRFVEGGFSVATNSATSALHIACLALGVGPGDTVWTSPISFVASANCALYCGAAIDFVDIEPGSFNLSVARLREKLLLAEKQGCLPKVVIPVHMCGQPCDMKGIALLAQEYGFRVIEDASHAIGAEYMSRRVGSCQFSDICIFSFHPVKVVTSAEGGMAVTNERSLALKMSVLRSHGITNDPKQMSKPKAGPWSYEQLDLGFNYRQTDLQAALGSSQLSRISDIVARRNQIAQNYDFLLQDLPIVLPAQHPESKSSWHLYIIRLGLAEIDNTHRKIFEHMRNSGIGVALHYIPIHTQPYFAQLGFLPEQYPNAMQHYSEAITLPLFPTLATDDQQFVVSTLKDALAF